MVGIESNKTELYEYNNEYPAIAEKTIEKLEKVIGNKVIKIEHVGSTAIIGIKSKPIIDIAIGIEEFDNVQELKEILEDNDFIFTKLKLNNSMVAFKVEYNGKRTHNVYLVKYGGERWKEFVLFRDYLNKHSPIATEYEKLKLELSKTYKDDIHKYTLGKKEFISNILSEAEKELV